MAAKPESDDDTFSDTRTVILTTSRLSPVASRADWLHTLVVQQGAEPGKRLAVGALPLRMGRRAPCELVLADTEVSGMHCQVSAEPGVDSLTVTDLGSTNGTFVDGQRVVQAATLPIGALLQLGRQVLRHEFRPPQDAASADELERDLERAANYIRSMLPPPMRQGPVRTEWFFQPSARLGGDGFGNFQIDDDHFAGYLIDVSGHGIGAAVHTVSVLNVLRQKALPGVDLADPTQVLNKLNAMFPMDEHGGLFFTMWYGVYQASTRRLSFASAGHHPAYLVGAQRLHAEPLQTRNPMIGVLPGHAFTQAAVPVAEGSVLYVFSDGIFEVDTPAGKPWRLADFVPLLTAPLHSGLTEPERLVAAVRQQARPGPPDDDVSMLSVTFLS
jgi:serine phosphatase RsbU (regulator of sigma subunit)